MVDTLRRETTGEINPPLVLEIPEPTYEKIKWPYLLSLPVMWLLIIWVVAKKMLLGLFGRKLKTNTYLFDGASRSCRKIKDEATNWKGLDVVYNHHFGSIQGIEGWVSDFWIGMMNAQAVRNRLLLIKYLLAQKFNTCGQGGSILSLASGSAQGIIETLAFLKERGIKVRAVLVDNNQEALIHSKELAQKYGVEEQVTTIQGNIRDLFRLKKTLNGHLPFDAVEMVGFLEYVSDRTAVRLIESVYSVLRPGGIFLTNSIGNNPERWFLYHVIDWRMKHRRPKHLEGLVRAGGFEDCRIISEPHSIFHIALATSCKASTEMV
ncbi:MAG: class I SAM-dependent methyltransferase [Patescibacteria group bacterium]